MTPFCVPKLKLGGANWVLYKAWLMWAANAKGYAGNLIGDNIAGPAAARGGVLVLLREGPVVVLQPPLAVLLVREEHQQRLQVRLLEGLLTKHKSHMRQRWSSGAKVRQTSSSSLRAQSQIHSL